jgi:hypothetical protein
LAINWFCRNLYHADHISAAQLSALMSDANAELARWQAQVDEGSRPPED